MHRFSHLITVIMRHWYASTHWSPLYLTHFLTYLIVCLYSAFSGFFAALAGLLGKLGADGDSNALQYLKVQCQPLLSLSESCIYLTSLVRVLCLTLMLGANGLMLSCFVKGLHETDSLTATVTSAAVNFLLSAAGGSICFQEELPPRWFLGAFVILLGMAFIIHGDNGATEEKTKVKTN